MLEFFNFFLLTTQHMISLFFIELDGYFMGHFLIASMILGAVISATIGAVGIIATKARRG